MTNSAEIRVTLDKTNSLLLAKPVNGNGGYQKLLLKLQASSVVGVDGTIVYVDVPTAKTLVKLSKQNLAGGYARRLQPVIDQLLPLKKALNSRNR